MLPSSAWSSALITSLLVNLAFATPLPTSPLNIGGGINDFSCKSSTQPYPVVLIHGLGASKDFDINLLQAFLAHKGFCTFATTYGAYPQYPLQGGLRSIPESSKELSDYINLVAARTSSSKVDLVGHSEGGFMTLYVPKFYPSTRKLIRKAFAIAPPTNGADLSGLFSTSHDSMTVGRDDAGSLMLPGCEACNDLSRGSNVIKALNEGGVAQRGIEYTIITSKYDEIVTPVPDASFVHERGVHNYLIQDVCPMDLVEHVNEAEDPNVWHMVLNELQDQQERKFTCVVESVQAEALVIQ